jgi:dTMP kinase
MKKNIPKKTGRRFYGHGIPGVRLEELQGKLIAIEGADGSGRSTQIARLVEWLETGGHPTVQVGLKRSTLVSEELDRAQAGNILSRSTLSLFYATDFADQLENIIIPALRAGFIVLADRYIYTLMARDLVRGMDEAWLKNLYGIALVPDAVFYLDVRPEQLVQRVFAKNQALEKTVTDKTDTVEELKMDQEKTREELKTISLELEEKKGNKNFKLMVRIIWMLG